MPTDHLLQNARRYQMTKRVTLVGAAVNSLLALAQLLGGLATQSQGLIADGLHTLSDLLSDFIVLIAAREAHKEADSAHPYGHGRIETIATSILGITLIVVAAGIAIDVLSRLLHPERLLQPQPLALAFALLAVISKEGLYQYTQRAARKVRSRLLEANAWHHRSDAISSTIVIIGIIGSLAGIRYFDAIAAVIVALFIAHIGWKLVWQSGQELIDLSLDTETLKRTETVISNVHGVINMHLLRSRKSGGDAFADVHIQVPPDISVSEGHQIAEAVRYAIIQHIDEITDVTVHTDPEDDMTKKPCNPLPLRGELLELLGQQWNDLEITAQLDKINIHYLSGKINLELFLPISTATIHVAEIQQLKVLIESQPNIHRVEIFYY